MSVGFKFWHISYVNVNFVTENLQMLYFHFQAKNKITKEIVAIKKMSYSGKQAAEVGLINKMPEFITSYPLEVGVLSFENE